MFGGTASFTSRAFSRPGALAWIALAALAADPAATRAAPIHTSYLWHMHQPIYWPERSTWNGAAVEFAHETIALGHSQSDVFSIFNSDDRVHDYQDYPRVALQSVLEVPDAGAQVSFAGSLIQNVSSLGASGWNGGRYAPDWSQPYREAMGWTTSGGRRRLDPVVVGFHHPIAPLLDQLVFRRMLQTQKAIMPGTWGSPALSTGFFPAEMCFSERLIPALVAEGVEWAVVPDIHIARACADYPYAANQDNCDPPNPADQQNPAQGDYYTQTISRGVTTKVPAPYGLRPHRAQHVDPETGAVSSLVVVPAANAMSWNEGYGTYGTGEIDAIAAHNDPAKPMLVLFAHDGDNAWSGGDSYFNQNVTQFTHAAVARGYEPTTVAEFLADHPVDAGDVVHVEDGGWVNADGDFGSPQFINWNWPLAGAAGGFDIPGGWAEDERNWAVLTAAVNRVETAEQMTGAPLIARVVDPTQAGTSALEKAWHFLLVGFESGYMYYGTALDFEIKPTLAANRAVEYADPLLAAGADLTPPTVWLPQRLPWNPGGRGGGALWGYPGGPGAPMTSDFHVWTFVHDVSGVAGAELRFRLDADGINPLATTDNETYAGGPGVGAWQSLAMTRRAFPKGNVHNDPKIDFSVAPTYIADEFWAQVSGLSDVLVDYYVEAVDSLGNLRKSPIQHVYVGSGTPPADPAVSWEPESPVAGGSLTIHYDAVAGALPDATNPVRIHIGHSGWTEVIAPDPEMTWNPTSARWDYTYAIASTATAVDFVFNDGAGTWDNNGGADWHVAVSGAGGPPHVIDGALDAGLVPVSTCGGRELYADYDGRYLYVAAPAVAGTAGLDHFVCVARPTTTGTRAAPWAKAGTVPVYDLLLGNEDSNNWSGWFDAAGGEVTAGVQKWAGAWLEGLVDAQARWGSAPESLDVCFAGYASPDGGALATQAPCGDGNGSVEPGERVRVGGRATTAVAPLPAPPTPAIRLLSGNPSRGPLRVGVDAGDAGRVVVDLLDLHGRRVARLFDGEVSGPFEVVAAGPAEGGRWAAGIYFLQVRGTSLAAARRVAFVR
ncbi:MAG: hypothetical protein A2W00_03145 [Candidatus Eisenbacteria bacterium RBG_16_71_46]|nr:MAG: hypothetical protein A2W00_03145 [Candidatus Eisenbacteria bacterium RBG_16_71_46]